MQPTHTRRDWFATALAIAAMLVVTSTAPPAFAASMLVQPEIKVYRTSQYVAQPQDEVWDVLNARDITIQVKITEENLTATKYAKIALQTSNTRSGQDWQTMETLTFTEGTETAPHLEHKLINVDHATKALGRYVRWRVEFEDSTATQWIAFKAIMAARN